jgi:hypothetical protein
MLRNAGAGSLDAAPYLVAGYYGRLRHQILSQIGTEVGTAKAGVLNAEQYFARPGLRNRNVNKGNLAGSRYLNRFHIIYIM